MTVLVDSSVWIDYFADRHSPYTALLDTLLDERKVIMGDLVLVEILQGFRFDQAFETAREQLARLQLYAISDGSIALQSARNYRLLRGHGFTTRKTIDALVATRCIVEDWQLLYHDRDFDPFVTYLGLRPALKLS